MAPPPPRSVVVILESVVSVDGLGNGSLSLDFRSCSLERRATEEASPRLAAKPDSFATSAASGEVALFLPFDLVAVLSVSPMDARTICLKDLCGAAVGGLALAEDAARLGEGALEKRTAAMADSCRS